MLIYCSALLEAECVRPYLVSTRATACSQVSVKETCCSAAAGSERCCSSPPWGPWSGSHESSSEVSLSVTDVNGVVQIFCYTMHQCSRLRWSGMGPSPKSQSWSWRSRVLFLSSINVEQTPTKRTLTSSRSRLSTVRFAAAIYSIFVHTDFNSLIIYFIYNAFILHFQCFMSSTLNRLLAELCHVNTFCLSF